jgi:glucose/arabinose dehydrogenase
VSRFVLGEDASAGQERVLLGAEASAADACTALPPTADCIPSPGDHIGADIVFASDGTLFVGTGDGGGKERVEETAFRAQDVEALGGKILRITRDGRGVASNPFYDGDPTSNRSKVWALGLRNPFRLTLAPGADLPVVADVGWITQDEITVAPAGSNLGWPCFEGDERTPRYEETERCVEMYGRADDVQPPVLAVPHSGSSSVTGGVFYTGRGYPEEYRSYFYANWTRNEILHARINASRGELEAKPSTFARGAGGPVAFRLGPDGLLYFLSLNYGELYRVSYAG